MGNIIHTLSLSFTHTHTRTRTHARTHTHTHTIVDLKRRAVVRWTEAGIARASAEGPETVGVLESDFGYAFRV